MQDVKLELDAQGRYDLVVGDNGDFERVSGFDTALWVSLFTDARASSSQVVLPEQRRGWVGDTVSPVIDRPLGGLLWLVDQRRLNQATLNEAIDYTNKALNWLLEDNLVSGIDVTGAIVPLSGITLTVTLTTLVGVIETHYYNLWELTGAD
jgi:phage gp46-like protein